MRFGTEQSLWQVESSSDWPSPADGNTTLGWPVTPLTSGFASFVCGLNLSEAFTDRPFKKIDHPDLPSIPQ